jgi:hypothetical protein
MLRTLFVLALVSAGIRYSLQGALYILLFYIWNAYFRPEQWAWSSIVYEMRLSLTIGVSLIVTSLFSSERLQLTTGPFLIFAFLAQTLLSTVFSPVVATLWPFWLEFAKVLLISYLIVRFVNSEERLRLTLIVIAVSLGTPPWRASPDRSCRHRRVRGTQDRGRPAARSRCTTRGCP